jgi:hypothetical protein
MLAAAREPKGQRKSRQECKVMKLSGHLAGPISMVKQTDLPEAGDKSPSSCVDVTVAELDGKNGKIATITP